MEIISIAFDPLVMTLNLIQLFLMVAVAAIAFIIARRGRSWLGYVLALGILFHAIHIILEIYNRKGCSVNYNFQSHGSNTLFCGCVTLRRV